MSNTMPNTMLRAGVRLLSRIRTQPATATPLACSRASAIQTASFSLYSSSPCQTPIRSRVLASASTLRPAQHQQKRNLYLQTELTPNPDALKFLPGCPVVPSSVSSPYIEYMTPRSTVAPPHPSPLASKIIAIDGVTSVFYGADFITVTKRDDANWAHIKPEVFALITEAVTSGASFVNVVDRTQDGEGGGEGEEEEADSLKYDENDSEVVGMIKELLETRIRPSIQEDGGDIEYCGFEDGHVILKLRGACRTCDSSTVTLKNGIERMLMHYIEDVKGVTQILDEHEDAAIKEFALFEERLKAQRGRTAEMGWGEK